MSSPVSEDDQPHHTPVRVIRNPGEMRTYRRELLLAGESVGFVPTMGALHAGHISLIREALEENRHVFVSIYVNPTQFAPNEDLSTYPRTWEVDMEIINTLDEQAALERSGSSEYRGRISAVFAPTTDVMYPNLPPISHPDAHGSFVTISPLSSVLEGASRPTFFRGVATVCMKLFNIITPDRVYLGQKDIQQTVVIRRMVEDFHLGIDVKIVPTVREPDGLAMSSRNVYLGSRRRRVATALYDALTTGAEVYECRDLTREAILREAEDHLYAVCAEQHRLPPSQRALFEIDYISLANRATLRELEFVRVERGAILSGAIKMLPLEEPAADEDCGVGGGTSAVRIIDNIVLEPEEGSAGEDEDE